MNFRSALILLLALTACSPSPPSPLTSDGKLDLERLNGSWLVVNYWATWCAPCITEIPELNKLAEDENIWVAAVNFDDLQGAELDKQVARLGIEVLILTKDPYEQLGYERPEVLPTTFVFDPQGQLVETLVGPQTRESIAATMVGT